MTVAIPLLWGVPPRHETLRYVAGELLTALSCSDEPARVLSAVLLSSLVEAM